jgi:hypothetical protein
MKKQLNFLIIIFIIGLIINIAFLSCYYIKTAKKLNDQKILLSEISLFLDSLVYREYRIYDKLPYSFDNNDSIVIIGNDLIQNFNKDKYDLFYKEFGNFGYLPKISQYKNYDFYIRMIQLGYFEKNIKRIFPLFGFNTVGLRTTSEKIKKNREMEIPIFLTYFISKDGKFYEPKLLINNDTLKLKNEIYFKYKYKTDKIGKQYIDFKLLFPTFEEYQSIDSKLSIEVVN